MAVWNGLHLSIWAGMPAVQEKTVWRREFRLMSRLALSTLILRQSVAIAPADVARLYVRLAVNASHQVAFDSAGSHIETERL